MRYAEDHRCALQRSVHVLLASLGLLALAVVVLLGVIIAFLFAAPPSLAHGPAEWIERGGFKNAMGELCCGVRDCFELTDADVKVTISGYYVASIKETVPYSEATPSPDGKFWRCQWGGKRKCFFAPPSAT